MVRRFDAAAAHLAFLLVGLGIGALRPDVDRGADTKSREAATVVSQQKQRLAHANA
jgi:hypothetical protein